MYVQARVKRNPALLKQSSTVGWPRRATPTDLPQYATCFVGVALRGHPTLRICALLVITVCFVSTINAQPRFNISISNPGELRIEADRLPPSSTWSFRNAYANALGIAERIDEFKAFGNLSPVGELDRIAVGEYRSSLPANKIAYSVKLSTPISTGWSC